MNLFNIKNVAFDAIEKTPFMKAISQFFKQDPKTVMTAVMKGYEAFDGYIKSVPNYDVQIAEMMGEAEACGLEPQAAIIVAMRNLKYSNLQIATYLKQKFPIQNKEVTAMKVKEIYDTSYKIWDEAHLVDEGERESSEFISIHQAIGAPDGDSNGIE